MSTVSDSNAYSQSLQRLKDSYESELAKTRTNQEKEVRKNEERHESDLQGVKDRFQKRLAEEKNEAREEVRKLKDELYSAKGKRAAEASPSAKIEEREELERAAEKRIEKVQKTAEIQLEAASRAANERIEDAIRAQKQSQVEETKPLREELLLYRNEGRDVTSEIAKARQASIEEFESAHLREKKNIVDSYERVVDHIRDEEKDLSDLYGMKLEEALLEQDAKTRKLVDVERGEFQRTSKLQRQEMQRIQTSYESELRNERNRNSVAERGLSERNQKDLGRALQEKDKVYQGYLEDNSKRVRAELGAREDLIRDLHTTMDPRRVSPALLERIQKEEAVRTQQKLDQVQEKDNARLDALRKRDHDEREGIREKFAEDTRALSKDFRREKELERRSVADAIFGMKDQEEDRVRGIEGRAQGAISRIYREQALEQVKARVKAKDALEEQRDSLNEQRHREVEGLELGQHLKDREWVLRLNALQRENAKQFGVERDQHEQEMANLKSDLERRIHELERSSKRLLEEKDRNQDAQSKQLEQSHREKERFLVEHYEEELDRMRRTNAQLIAKKS